MEENKRQNRFCASAEWGYFVPTVEFVAPDNEIYQFESSTSATWYRVGRTVKVLYNPSSPEDALTDDFTTDKGKGLIGCIAGTIFLVLSILRIFR
jgi:Protein of unknown function (DUF3592)